MLNQSPQNFIAYEPPKGLFEKVILRLKREQRIAAIRRLAVFGLTTISSALAFIPAFQMAKTGFAESGFGQFFSLLFSDFGIVVAFWQNFALSLLEALPVVSLLVLLGTLLIFLESLKLLVKNIKFIFNSKQLINQ